jgi:hypothetical protein
MSIRPPHTPAQLVIYMASRYAFVSAIALVFGAMLFDDIVSSWFRIIGGYYPCFIAPAICVIAIWCLLRMYRVRHEAYNTCFDLMNTIAHHLANPLQIMLHRHSIPEAEREATMEKAISSMVWVCTRVVPQMAELKRK